MRFSVNLKEATDATPLFEQFHCCVVVVLPSSSRSGYTNMGNLGLGASASVLFPQSSKCAPSQIAHNSLRSRSFFSLAAPPPPLVTRVTASLAASPARQPDYSRLFLPLTLHFSPCPFVRRCIRSLGALAQPLHASTYVRTCVCECMGDEEITQRRSHR